MMNHFFRLLLCAVCLSSCNKKAPVNTEHAAETVSSVPADSLNSQNISFKIYQILAKSPENISFSPVSFKNTVSTLASEADHKNKVKFEPLIGKTTEPEKSEDYSVSNSLWSKEKKHALSSDEINQWIIKNTCGSFAEPFQDLGPKTNPIFLSSLCFRGKWVSPFSKESSALAHFQSSPHASVSATMMKKTSTFRYYEDENTQWLELPFLNSPMVLWVALPKKRYQLQKTEEQLSEKYLKIVEEKLTSEKVDVTIPRFKFNKKLSYLDLMAQTGNAFIFNKSTYPKASKFSKISYSEVSQIAPFEFDEQGVNTAEANASPPKESFHFALRTKNFYADQPFLVALKNTKSNQLLLLGRVYQP